MLELTLGSLFSGIGGFELAGSWRGFRTIWQSEIDRYCSALLQQRFPGVPNLGDITRIDWRTIERPTVICGGFPCQDISYAGRGAGLAGARSGLWYEYARAVRELGPDYLIVENVAALFTRGLDAVLGTLADLGYDAEWTLRSAASVGAPHRRNRVWILAYPSRQRKQGAASLSPGPAGYADGDSQSAGTVADTDDAGRSQGDDALARELSEQPDGSCEPSRAHGVVYPDRDDSARQRDSALASEPAHPGLGSRGWWATEPDVGRVAYGVPAGVDRLRGLGNAIVPACALPCFDRILQLQRGEQ